MPQPSEAVSQVLPLQQEEDHKDDDDAGRRQRLEQRPGDLQDELDSGRVGWADLDGNRLLLLITRREGDRSVRRGAPHLLTDRKSVV